ncbi:hypothetical protein BAQU_0797 [Bifidobacterium aquikefiri]|uniref:Uncharacterized protein n=1 Tax=Bifidobacterium aquikefiri TaxID=1653207 RepID=A0A261G698_9BIFI|nr:hypothetical protein BAQU_0797 [Bifidobacterium aquikefiri]
MIFSPTPRVWNVHLVAQYIPHDPRLNALVQRFHNGHRVQGCKPLIMRKAATINTSKHFFQ